MSASRTTRVLRQTLRKDLLHPYSLEYPVTVVTKQAAQCGANRRGIGCQLSASVTSQYEEPVWAQLVTDADD
jgi:hypothetical protein